MPKILQRSIPIHMHMPALGIGIGAGPPPSASTTISVPCLLCNSQYLTVQVQSSNPNTQGIDLLCQLIGIDVDSINPPPTQALRILGLDPVNLNQIFGYRSQAYCPSCMTRLRNIGEWRGTIRKLESNVKELVTEIQGILEGTVNVGDAVFLDTYWVKSKIIEVLTNTRMQNQHAIEVFEVPMENVVNVMDVDDSHFVVDDDDRDYASSNSLAEPESSYTRSRSSKSTTRKNLSPSRKIKPKSSTSPSPRKTKSSPSFRTRISSVGNKSPRRDTRTGRKRVYVRGEFPCPHCPHVATMKNSLLTHTKRKHSGKLFKCRFCPAQFDDKNYALKHEKTVHMTLPVFLCNQCRKSFKSQDTLDKHIKRVHLGIKPPLTLTGPRKCEHCERILSNHLNLRRHISKYHGNSRNGNLTPRKFCPVCEKPCLSKQHVQNHMRSHYSKEELGKLPLSLTPKLYLTGPSTCEQCGKTLSSLYNLQRHISRHHGNEKTGQLPIRKYCPICEKPCLSKSHLDSHMRTHCSKEELQALSVVKTSQFICQDCPDKPSYSARRGLVRHIKNGHRTPKSLVKPITCTKCDEVFYGQKHIRKHNREKHPRKARSDDEDFVEENEDEEEIFGYDDDDDDDENGDNMIIKDEVEVSDDDDNGDEEENESVDSIPTKITVCNSSVDTNTSKPLPSKTNLQQQQTNFIKCVRKPITRNSNEPLKQESNANDKSQSPMYEESLKKPNVVVVRFNRI